MTQEAATLYHGTRERITAIATTLTAEQLATKVPACPLWTVRDLLGHLVGVCADLLSGNVDGIPEPPWTAAHVAARANRSVPDLIAEWTETATELERRIAADEVTGFFHSHPYVDSGTHEADLRGALGTDRGDPAVWLRVTGIFADAADDELGDTATVTVRTPDGEFTMGTDGEHTTVDTETYELFRALAGRRSRDQIAAWAWHGPAGELPVRLPVLDQTAADLDD